MERDLMDGTQWFRAAAVTFFLGVAVTLFWGDAPTVLALWLKLGLNLLVLVFLLVGGILKLRARRSGRGNY
jgi:hypothetical protein